MVVVVVVMALWLVVVVVGGVLVIGGDVDIGDVGRCEYFGSWDRLDR